MNKGSTFKRKELKYVITKEQKSLLLKAISDCIVPDKYEKYMISNVYLDTIDKRLIGYSILKPLYKEKIRIRSYGRVNSDEHVFIELKKKYKGIVYKRRISMPYGESKAYLLGSSSRTGQIENEIDYFLEYYGELYPSMLIAYNRHAFSGKEDATLRITFDDNITWRDYDVNLSSEIYGNKLLDDNQCLLEIKCSSAMPIWLARALSENHIYKLSFSKYGQAYKGTI
ncbi:polyphosphate polymerase domain-containing protein [Acidaminobacter sp. JC074]|uniref:polyphosphate polymerase domain-containing protein n=1 Tax=Acidaminobacter sp. JC074 TaxID=2530199 RepID=UPI001F10044D